MPRLLYSFKCPQGHCIDHFVDTTVKEVSCEECGEPASRQLSAPHFPLRQGVDVDMPTAADKWAKIHRQAGQGKTKDVNNDRYGGARSQDSDPNAP